jgi:hypothetical protein
MLDIWEAEKKGLPGAIRRPTAPASELAEAAGLPESAAAAAAAPQSGDRIVGSRYFALGGG